MTEARSNEKTNSQIGCILLNSDKLQVKPVKNETLSYLFQPKFFLVIHRNLKGESINFYTQVTLELDFIFLTTQK